MLEIHKQVKARSDLKKIWRYSYKHHGEAQADKYLDELAAGMKTIQDHQNIGISCDSIRTGYRCHGINDHYIFYQLTSSKINIIRVLHEKMKIANHL